MTIVEQLKKLTRELHEMHADAVELANKCRNLKSVLLGIAAELQEKISQ